MVAARVSLDGCLDLLNPHWHQALNEADDQYVNDCLTSGRLPARNRPSGNRARDCAVINWYCERAAEEGLQVRSVRAIFEEGDPIFDASAIRTLSHVQTPCVTQALSLRWRTPMVKLVDPTLPFADVVARRRREGAGAAATTFGLWASTHDWRVVYPEPTAVAGIGASEMALRDSAVDLTQQLIGASAGLLVDLGFQVCPVGAITSGMLSPSLLVWVAGETTTPQEREQLSSFNVPGVWIGSVAEAVDGWARIETGVFGDRAQFVRQFVAAVASLVEVPEAAYVSNNLSNEPRRTGPDGAGREAAGNVADLHEHGRGRTTTNRPGRQTAGS